MGVDVPFVLAGGDRQAGQSNQPVTLYLTVIVSPNTTPNPILSTNVANPQSIEVNKSPLVEATSYVAKDPTTTTRSIVATGSDTLSPPTDRPPSNPIPPATERLAGVSPVEYVLNDAEEAMATIDLSKTWDGALERVKWVMDTLSPVAEVGRDVLFPILN